MADSFVNHLARTSPESWGIHVTYAKGIYLFDVSGQAYIDLISGISVSNAGHNHPVIIEAIRQQLDKHLHVMVYGEVLQDPQTMLATKLCAMLPPSLNKVYFVNSGAEAVEGALKLAKRFTGRQEIVAMVNAYHGSTHGALSVMGDEALKIRYRPLLPGIRFIRFNCENDLDCITSNTACVITEPVQGEAGVIRASQPYISALREKCYETGALLIFDEIQTGMGRTGSMFAFEQFNVIPDILLLAKALGGGMPLGAFISSAQIMDCLSVDPPLGHLTTFGGHPVSCAAAIAHLEIIESNKLYEQVEEKKKLFIQELVNCHPIKEIRAAGLLMAIQFGSEAFTQKVISECFKHGVFTDWFLFRPDALRVAPPLIISTEEIQKAGKLVRMAIEAASKKD